MSHGHSTGIEDLARCSQLAGEAVAVAIATAQRLPLRKNIHGGSLNIHTTDTHKKTRKDKQIRQETQANLQERLQNKSLQTVTNDEGDFWPKNTPEEAARLMYRCWDTEGRRLAMWRVYLFGEWEYHLTNKHGDTLVEAYTEGMARFKAGAVDRLKPAGPNTPEKPRRQ